MWPLHAWPGGTLEGPASCLRAGGMSARASRPSGAMRDPTEGGPQAPDHHALPVPLSVACFCKESI